MPAVTLQFRNGCKREDLDEELRPLFDRLVTDGVLQQKGGLYMLGSLYRIGRISVNAEGYGYVEASEKGQKDLLIDPRDIGGAKEGDVVLVKRIIARRGRASAKVIAVVEKARHHYIAYTYRMPDGTIEIRDIKTAKPVSAKIPHMSATAFKEGTVFKVDIDTDEVVEVLGHLQDARVDEPISLLLYGRRDAFPAECVEEALRVERSVNKAAHPDRVDLTTLDFCTIDPVTAKDFDDAIYFDTDTHTLYVAIADVSHYVPYFSEIDKEAKRRGFTTYFPHKAFPMLPRELSEHICSLKPHVDRLAFVAEIKLDPDTLQPLEERFYEAIIHSKFRFNYDSVDGIFAEGYAGDDETIRRILRWLIPLREITQKLRKARLQKGFDFRSEEIKLTIDANHELLSTRIETGTPSHSLIEECMLLANRAAAKRFSGEGDAIFRIHEPPELSKLETLLSELATVGLFVEEYETAEEIIRAVQKEAKKLGIEAETDAHIIRSLKQASYASHNVGHFGLGFRHYSHFTSPIRRYSDLILHRLIKAQLRNDKEETEYLLRNIDPLCVRVSELERTSAKAEWDFRDRKFARWAAAHKGETFEAQVIEAGESAKAQIKDPNAPQGIVVTLKGDDLTLFDTIRLRIVEADIALALVTAEAI